MMAVAIAGPERERPDLVDHVREHVDHVAVAEREHRIQMHGRPFFGHAGGDDMLGAALGE